MSTGVFRGVCDVRTAWLCVPVLLGYLVWDVQHWSLQPVGWSQILELRSNSGRALAN